MASDQDIDALLRYYRARRLLLASALVPISMGCLYAADDIWTGQAAFFPFLAWTIASSAGSIASASLLVHCTKAGLPEKCSRLLALLREKVTHQLAVYLAAACLFALLHLMHGQELPPPPPGQSFGVDDVFRKPHLLFLLFWTLAFIPVMRAVTAEQPRKRTKWWLAAFAICLVFEPLGRYLFLLPPVLALPLYLAGMSSRTPQRRNALMINASDAYECSALFIFLAVMVQFPLWMKTLWEVDLIAFAMFTFSNALLPFLQYERIRHGLFITSMDELNQDRLGWADRKAAAQTFGRLAEAKKNWRWIQLVLSLHRHAWLFALASTAAAVAISFFHSQ